MARADARDHADIAAAKAGETFQQPKITGYRQLSPQETELMNEGKALAVQCGEFVAKLRQLDGRNTGVHGEYIPALKLDQRWVSMGASDLQVGFMKLVRGIAQPTTF